VTWSQELHYCDSEAEKSLLRGVKSKTHSQGRQGTVASWHGSIPALRLGVHRKLRIRQSRNDSREAKPSPPFQLLVFTGVHSQYSSSSGTEAVVLQRTIQAK